MVQGIIFAVYGPKNEKQEKLTFLQKFLLKVLEIKKSCLSLHPG